MKLIAFALCTLFATTAAAETLFHCPLSDGELRIEAEGGARSLIISDTGGDQVMVTAPGQATIRHGYVIYNRAEDRWLRFVVGDESMMVFERWAAPSGLNEPERQAAGLLILDGDRITDAISCVGVAGFLHGFDYAALAEDDPALAERLPDLYAPEPPEGLAEFGTLLSVEDAPYPLFVLELELAESGAIETFLLDASDGSVDPALLEGLVGRRVDIVFHTDTELSVIDYAVLVDGALPPGTPELADTFAVRGMLFGADEVTESDLPGEFFVEDASGEVLTFPFYIPPEMVAINGSEVIVWYDKREVRRVTDVIPSSE